MIFKHWYFWVSHWLIIVPTVILAQLPSTTTSRIHIQILLVGLVSLGFIGTLWISPYWASFDNSSTFNIPPFRAARIAIFMAWIIPVAVAAVVFMSVFAVIEVGGVYIGEVFSPGLFGIVLMMMTTIISYWLSRRIPLNIRKLAAIKLICFGCGYDLRCDGLPGVRGEGASCGTREE